MQPDFTVTNETAPAVADICTRLDGLPLAIELVAARIHVLPPQALLARLGHRLTLAAGGARDLPARQQTLRDTIGWSYHLLAPDEQTLFARLAVFGGGATLDGVEAVCNPDGTLDVLAGLESLVAQSLLHAAEGVEEEPRFRMLETIHEYAWEQLEAGGEAETLRQRHATYFLALAESGEQALRGRTQAVWLRRLEAEHDNLRAALGWAQASVAYEVGLRLAGALWQFWWMRGYFSEGRRAVEDLLAHVGSGTAVVAAPVRAKALNAAAAIAISQGDLGQASAWCEESLGLARAAGAQEVSATALYGLGLVAATAVCGLGLVAAARGDYDQATAWYEESLVLLRDLGDRWGCAHIMANQAWVALVQGDYVRAMVLCHEGLALNREIGDSWGRSVLLWILGDVARLQGDASQARALLEESLALSQELGDNRNAATFLISLGTVALMQGEYARAGALYRKSLALSRTMGNLENVSDCLEGLAGAVWGGEHSERAARLFGAAAAGRVALGTPRAPAERAAYDRRVAVVRAALGEEQFARAWAEGQAMTLEQAVASALAHRAQ